MTARRRALRLWPLLTGTQTYEKVVSTRNRGHGQFIEAPIVAYLIETPNGRILYDVGCDYRKIATPELRARFFEPMRPQFEPPRMSEAQRIPHYLAGWGSRRRTSMSYFSVICTSITPAASCELPGCEVHVHREEVRVAALRLDGGVFADECENAGQWQLQDGEYQIAAGVHAIATPGHTAGHMSLLIELPHGAPVILCGDAADLPRIWPMRWRPATAGRMMPTSRSRASASSRHSRARRAPSCGPIMTSMPSAAGPSSRPGADRVSPRGRGWQGVAVPRSRFASRTWPGCDRVSAPRG